MLPQEWEKKLIDLNVEVLRDKQILWADYIFISAMSVQEPSALEVIERCKKLNRAIVAGGPLFTGEPASFPDVDHLVLNEGEITLPEFLHDLEQGCLKKEYSTCEYAKMLDTPPPDYSLARITEYGQLSLQFSRGCPFNCDFCEITSLLGRKFRTKSPDQIIRELDNIYAAGHRGKVFFVRA